MKNWTFSGCLSFQSVALHIIIIKACKMQNNTKCAIKITKINVYSVSFILIFILFTRLYLHNKYYYLKTIFFGLSFLNKVGNIFLLMILLLLF